MHLLRRSLRRFLCLCALVLATATVQAAKINVVTTLLPLHVFTANVAGDLAQVHLLLPPGVGPHDYQITPRDLKRVDQANLVVISGLSLDGWIQGILKNSTKGTAISVLPVTQGLTNQFIFEATELGVPHGAKHAHSHHAGEGPNPHFWLDPRLASQVVTNLIAVLSKADPANAAGYQANGQAYLQRLQALDQELEKRLTPLRSSAFITFHDAFPYFTRRYALKMVGVVEEVPDVEPSHKYLKALQEVIRKEQVKAIFTEPQFSSKLVRQLARDYKVQVGELDPMETGTNGLTAYEEVMRRNVEVMEKALK